MCLCFIWERRKINNILHQTVIKKDIIWFFRIPSHISTYLLLAHGSKLFLLWAYRIEVFSGHLSTLNLQMRKIKSWRHNGPRAILLNGNGDWIPNLHFLSGGTPLLFIMWTFLSSDVSYNISLLISTPCVDCHLSSVLLPSAQSCSSSTYIHIFVSGSSLEESNTRQN